MIVSLAGRRMTGEVLVRRYGASPEAGLGWRAPMRQKAPGEEADQDDR